ncbi:hypothetical protein [Diatraea saccharalis granulovirus]|uniref:Pif-6 n=1 Tax=Diatraea saccharalis granulovirus TaxID=1675862 RepID=A0A0R7EYU6_9BBAC|nr:hypothetical protein [Diatraea saccharalis granulovirus]AKN80752.1 hypothetical protein [Diatraea saccharalis granulovirus]
MLRTVSEGLFDIMEKYHWRIVNREYIEVDPNDRERAWKDILILALRITPQTYRSGIRRGMLEHFDFKQPIYYDIKRKELGLSTKSVLEALNPPTLPLFKSKMITPFNVVSGFILIMLSYLIMEGIVFI